MNDNQLLRYSRHLLLDEIGIEGQRRLLDAHALVIGAGGLGSPVALYLASAGVGRITIVDADVVDLGNLQRQIAHTLARVGQTKVASAAAAIAAINPDVQVDAQAVRADAAWLDAWLALASTDTSAGAGAGVHVVIDCSDNFVTRHAVNAACVKHRLPLVSGAAIGFDAQISVYDTRVDTQPCYACVFPPEATLDAGRLDAIAADEGRCATLGVFAPLVGIIGSMQAAEALKLLAGVGSSLAGRLQMLDARTMEWSEIRLPRAPACGVCGGR